MAPTSAPPSMSLPRTLRVNRNPHPGLPAAPRPKRTTEEVQKEKAIKMLTAKEKAQAREQDILRTAELEDKMRREHEEKLKNANNPPASTLKKILRPRKEPASALTNTHASDEAEIIQDGVSSDSEEEFQFGEEDEEDDDDDEVMDVESEDEEEVGEKKRGRPKKKEKGGLRKAVISALPVGSTADKTIKRKADTECQPRARPSKTSKKVKSGIREGWQAPLGDPVNEEDSIYVPESCFALRAQHDAGEVAERRAMGKKRWAFRGDSQSSTGTRIRSLAKVVPTTTVTTFIKPSISSQVANSRLKKEQIRLSHLPTHLQAAFDNVFGYTAPWATPDIDDLTSSWSDSFLLEDASSFDIIPQKLVEDCLHAWRNKFASAALTYLQNHVFRLLESNSTDSRAELCTWLLSGEEHTRPFYFRIYEEPDEEDLAAGEEVKVKASGLFQSAIVSAVLGTHIAGISAIPSAQRSKRRPVGALVLTIQAIKRALAMWTTGEKLEQQRPYNDFSKTNWGNTTVVREGKVVPILTTTNLVDIVEKLKDKQWDKILDAASQAAKTKKANIFPVVDDMAACMTKPIFELVDDDSDLD
ncbi:hypothetical protein BDZ97DRAFT_2065642 [Flammula alnicola]|nr:hypothetical protein BDZ97DRAFT_2065642 [Flammula alnicola]